MTISITVDGTSYDVPSSASDTNWAPAQVAFEQALATAVNEALATPTWVPLTLTNSWADIGGGLAPAAGYLDPFGMMHLRFAIDSGTSNTAAATLAAGQRPPYLLSFPALDGGGSPCQVAVLANGEVRPIDGASSNVQGNGVNFECAFSVVANP